MSSIAIDNNKNQSAGTRGTSKGSLYFRAGSDSSSSVHEVTLNYDTGHWCSCRGMIAKKRKFGGVADPHQPTKLAQTSRHYCKHIQAIRTADPMIRIEARKMRNEFFGINETPYDPETVDAPFGRRSAINATHLKKAARGSDSARERLAEIEEQVAGLRSQVAIEDTLAALRAQHGEAAVNAAMKG